MNENLVAIRGGGDIATGIAHRLFRSGFKILVLEAEKPTVIRRAVSFAQAVYDGKIEVEGVTACHARNIEEINAAWGKGEVPVIVDESCNILKDIKVNILVDAILAKRNIGTRKSMAPITIAAGPGFKAGEDVDVVIETQRGHNLGMLIFDGLVIPDTGIPGTVLGFSEERVLRAPCAGRVKSLFKIGDAVKKDDIVCMVDNMEVRSRIDGVLRGIIMDDLHVEKGLKIGDVDPRGVSEYCFTISDKARSVGGGVLEAVLYMKSLLEKEGLEAQV